MVNVLESEVATTLVLRVLLGGEEVGRSVDSNSTRVTLGRDAYTNVRLQDPHVSRIHAVIYRKPWGLVLHNRSTIGTVVNGRSVTTHLLADKDVISIAPYRIVVEIRAERESAYHEHAVAGEWTPDDARTLSAGELA